MKYVESTIMKTKIVLSQRNATRINIRTEVIIVSVLVSLFTLTIVMLFIFNISYVKDVRGVISVGTIASGNWSDASIWSTGTEPTASDLVIIENGYDVILDCNVTCASITITAPLSDGKSDFIIDDNFLVNVTGDVVINGGNSDKRMARLIFMNNSELTIEGNLTVNSSSVKRAIIDMRNDSCKMNLACAINLNSTVILKNGSNNIVNFNGTSAQVFPASSGLKFRNVHFNNTSSTGIKPDADINNNVVAGNLRVQAGTFDNDGYEIAGKGVKNFEIADGAKFILKGTSSFPSGFNIDLNKGSTVIYDGDGTQSIVKQDYGHLTIRNIGNKIFPPGKTIQIEGDFTTEANNCITTGSAIVFNGNTTQYILGSKPFTFYNMTVNNSLGVILNNSIAIDNVLTFSDGNINTSTSDMLTLNEDATASPGGVSSFINGPAIKYTVSPSLFTFPIGKNNYYRPLSIEPTNNDITIFTAEYFDIPYPNTNSTELSLNHISQIEYFQLDRNGTANAKVCLTWDGNSLVNNSSLADLRVARWDGIQWVDMGNTANTGDSLSGSITSNIITTFSPFTLGSTTIYNPLPIELANFSAVQIGSSVLVNWETASETNNDYFTVETSTDGANFKIITIVAGAGNSSTLLKYNIFDEDPVAGMSYYRLKQTDFDGQYKYSQMVSVQFEGNKDFNVISITPNPFVTHFNINYTLESEQPIKLFIVNVRGQIVLEKIIESSKGNNRFTFTETSSLTKGIYIVNFICNGQRSIHKILKI